MKTIILLMWMLLVQVRVGTLITTRSVSSLVLPSNREINYLLADPA